MNTKLKRSYPFDSSPVLTSKNNPLGVSQVPLHKKMTMTPPAVNVTSHVPGSPSWPTIVTTGTRRDSYSNHNNYIQNMPTPTIDSTKQPPSTPVSKGRKNMKNLQLVVPPVRSSISAPSSPQLSQISGTHTHNRRPSTPICVYQNKPSEHSTKIEADPMALISRTENEIDEESPYKDGPICILPNLYLGTEINAANRPMLQRMNVEYILNVGKEVVVPYMDEIAGFTSVYKNRDIKTYTDHQLSPGLSISSSVSSEHSYQTATSSPLAQSPNFDSSMPSSPTFALTRSDSFKRSSLTSSRPQSMSFQLAQKALTSGNVLTVPATHEFRQLKYKKFFWTHNQENLINDFTPAFAFIDEARSAGKNVLVHCQCGVSRSASLIIGYVMKANCMTLNQAYEFVKNRSSYISPNMSLVYQLVDFEKTLKLNGNNNVSSASKSGAEPVRSHSRSSSIESDLLLKSHRRSSSLPRSNTISGASNGIDSPPRTPGPSDSLSCTNQQQATIKGEPGRFHVITAEISTLPISPSVSTPSTASPTSNSISPTSSTSSPTTPTTDELTNTSTSHSSRLAPSTKTSQSSLSANSCKNVRPHSPSALNTPLSPTLPYQKPSISSNSSTISLALPEFNLENANISLLSYPSRISTLIPNHHTNSKGNGGGQNSGFFTLDSIFSPTRTASPIRSPSFNDLWGESD